MSEILIGQGNSTSATASEDIVDESDLEVTLQGLVGKLVVLAKTNGMFIVGKFSGVDEKAYFIESPLQVQQMQHPQSGQPVMALGPYLPQFVKQPESDVIPVDFNLVEALYEPVQKLCDLWVKATSGLEIAPANAIVR